MAIGTVSADLNDDNNVNIGPFDIPVATSMKTAGAMASDTIAETKKGFGNYIMVLGIIETVTLFVKGPRKNNFTFSRLLNPITKGPELGGP